MTDVAEVLTAHTPSCSGPRGHLTWIANQRVIVIDAADEHRCGPVFCVECSAAAHDWVTWTPTHVAAHLQPLIDAEKQHAVEEARTVALGEAGQLVLGLLFGEVDAARVADFLDGRAARVRLPAPTGSES